MSITPSNVPKTSLEQLFRRLASDAADQFNRTLNQKYGGLIQGGALNGGALFGNIPISNLGSLKWKEPVTLASVNNITKSGSQTVDGVSSGSSGERILLRNQTAPAENGIWNTASGAWTRAADMDASDEFSGAAVIVLLGNTFAATAWYCTNATAPTVGSTSIAWAQFPVKTHDHTSAAGDGGILTGDEHDGFSEYAALIASPSSPAAGKVRHYVRDFTSSGVRPYIPHTKDENGIIHDLWGDIDTLVRNVTGSTIDATKAVYFSGNETGTTLGPFDIALADGDDSAKLPCIGITLSSVADGGYTMVRRLGYIRTLDTSAFTAGDLLYPSTTAGGLTATKPAPYTAPIARVIRSHASAGVIYVAPPGLLGVLGALDHTHTASGDGGLWPTVSSQAYSAGDFTTDTGTWTVDSGDLTDFSYSISGTIMHIWFTISSSSTASSPMQLRVTIPAGKTSARTHAAEMLFYDNGGVGQGACLCRCTAGGTLLTFVRDFGNTAWPTSTNNLFIRGQLAIEIQ